MNKKTQNTTRGVGASIILVIIVWGLVLGTLASYAQEYARSVYPPSSQANTPLTVRTVDNAVSKTSPSELIFPNGSLAMGGSDGSLSVTLGGGGTPGGINTQLQYNNAGVFGGISGVTSNGTSLTALPVAGVITQTSASATAFESGPNGSTNPGCRLVNSTVNAVNGIQITGRGTGQGALIEVIGPGATERLYIRSRGVGSINFGPGSGSTDVYWAWNTNTGSYTQSAGTQLGWTSAGTNADTTQDTAFNRNAPGIVEVNNGNPGQWGALKLGNRDAGTNTITPGLYVEHQSSGTPAVGLGTSVIFNLPTSTTTGQNAGQIYSAWNIVTHASRSSFIGFKTVSNASAFVDAYLGGVRTAVVTDNTALSLFEIALPTLAGGAGRLSYTVYCSDGTDVQIRRGVMEYSAANKAGSYVTETAILNEAASVSSGTLSATFTVTSGTNKITLQITPDTSLSNPTTYYVKWELANLSESIVSVL